MVDSLDSDLYGNSYGRYINHSVSPNVVVKVKMVAGIPSILLCATSVPALSIDYGDRRPSVPDWMRSTGRTRAPVPADETACAALVSTTAIGDPQYPIGCVPRGGRALLSQPTRLLVPHLVSTTAIGDPPYPIGCVPRGGRALLSQPTRLLVPL